MEDLSIVQMANKHMQLISSRDVGGIKIFPIADYLIKAEAFEEAGRRALLIGLDDEPGLRLPWDELTDKVRIAPGKLVIWTGYMHHGKSQMLKQIMLCAMQQSERVAIASMEEEPVELWCDMARMACGTQQPGVADLNAWSMFCRRFWLYSDQGPATTRRLIEATRYAARELKINHFVIDSLMTTDIDKDDYNAQTRFARELKALAKDEKITVHLVAHMRKRDGRGGDESVGSVQEIAGPHEIGSLADYVFTVWRDKREVNERPAGCRDAVLKVEKQRGRFNWIGQFGLNYHYQSRQYVRGMEAMEFWPGAAFMDSVLDTRPRKREPGEDLMDL